LGLRRVGISRKATWYSCTWLGKQAGEYLSIPATNETLTLSCIYIFRIAHGKIAEVWNLWDRLGELQQLAVVIDL
jgi:predicted ester cyclase